MMANDPLFEGTTALELWRHDDEEENGCHVALYYRSNGEKDIYEMHMGDHIIPLHPEFPMGFALAAHCLMHICQSLYSGELVERSSKVETLFGDLLNEWREKGDETTPEAQDG